MNNKYLLITIVMFIVVAIILSTSTSTSTKNVIENFQEPIDDLLSVENQTRYGKETVIDKLKRAQIPFVTNKYRGPDFQRFKVQLFRNTNFRNRISMLKDDTKQFNSIRVNSPINSLTIEAVPNDMWRFCQYFSIIIYLKHDPSLRIVFHVPKDARSVYYEIPDTNKKGELLEWMKNFDTKIVVFMTNFYEPVPDLYDETFFKKRLLVPPESPPESPLTDGKGLKNGMFSLDPNDNLVTPSY